MKASKFIAAILCLIGLNVFAQTNTVTGIITNVKPHFAGEHSMIVNKTELVLITDLKDKTGKTFEINEEYKDILIERNGRFILNPKYANMAFEITYALNGKGWKCIKTIKPVSK